MNRRDFLAIGTALGASALAPSKLVFAQQSPAEPHGKILILVELKGGNDGLNTVIPFADPKYLVLRPGIGIRRDHVLQLDERTGLHPAMQALLPIWREGQLAIVQGVGYPAQNRSHFRSMEIWDTASHAEQYLRDGWLTRAFGDEAASFSNGALPFSASVKTTIKALAAKQGVSVIRVTLGGFDTHQNQPVQHARLLGQLSEGLAAIRTALIELDRWNDALVMTCAEFGRCARENDSNGTDHGSAAPHFVMGGRVNGGLHGAAPQLGQLDGNHNLPMNVDFRQMYATILDRWLGMDAGPILGARFETLPLLRA
ncbi:hypothetical protein ASG35_23510 [Burkholderia sp. Leaf177]|uniref:DUF1501 domain-containing protein n=1 Tax=Burkholderia sp. Leaf177 TaxID=1736287 RepID=UPI0006FDDE40|nr:DUF1501 domain-containing protein [Burkholderia sp. Leaf177]KQR87106.1 hypothetical protein ASG35_23510 [Burkholderia sp. Leaf177]